MSETEVLTPTPIVDKPAPKKKKEKSKARKIVEWILFIVFGLLFAFILAGNINGMINKKDNYGQSIRFGVGSFIVLTDSMEPEIPQDSAIITYKEDCKAFADRLAKGETIDVTFANVTIPATIEPDTPEFKFENGGRLIVTNQIMTHRLVEVHEDTTINFGDGRFIFVTTGINNGGYESLKGQYQEFTEKEYLGTVKVTNAFLGKVFQFIASPIGLIILLLVPAGYLIVVSSIDILRAMKETEEREDAVAASGGGKLDGLSDEDRERLKRELLDEMINAKKGENKDEKHE